MEDGQTPFFGIGLHKGRSKERLRGGYGYHIGNVIICWQLIDPHTGNPSCSCLYLSTNLYASLWPSFFKPRKLLAHIQLLAPTIDFSIGMCKSYHCETPVRFIDLNWYYIELWNYYILATWCRELWIERPFLISEITLFSRNKKHPSMRLFWSLFLLWNVTSLPIHAAF